MLVAGIAAFKQSYAASPVPSAQFLRDWIEYDTFVWLINEEIVDEYKEILRRRGVRSHLVGVVVNLIRFQAEEVPLETTTDISPDPGDEPFCSCAEAGEGDFIVTLNPRDFPQRQLRAHVILLSAPIPTTGRKRPR